ncbi:RIP metalloprotease RseP, partial [Paracoccaceae bacterium]|nr:RIP metalloprotease RseP [Paracoccaceae bacterium]
MFAFGVVIFVHELGHFIIARLNRIDVSVFSIGFGPRVISFKDKKGTEWQFAIIPLGGFVKFLGDENIASIKTQGNDTKVGNLKNTQFEMAPLYSRFFTVLAGPLANFLFSVLIFSLVFLIQGISVEEPVVGKVNGYYEANYDLKVNDQILKVEDKKISSFSDIFSHMKKPNSGIFKLTIKRGDLEKEIELPYLLQPIVEAIEPLSAASLSGLEIGDVFLTMEGKKLLNFNDLREKIINSEGKVMKITIFRDGKILEKAIQPVLSPIENRDGNFDTIYRIGVAGGPIFYPRTQTPGVWKALLLGAEATKGVIIASYKGIKGIISGQVDPKHLSGPVGIAHAVSDTIKSGLVAFLSLVAIISTGIGFVNLLPIPILDGGHI